MVMIQIFLIPKQLKILEEALKIWIDDFEEGTVEYFPPEWKDDFKTAQDLKQQISSQLNELPKEVREQLGV
jgi:hypothetical protein